MDAERRGCTCVGVAAALAILVIAVALLIFWIANYETATRQQGASDPPTSPPVVQRFDPDLKADSVLALTARP